MQVWYLENGLRRPLQNLETLFNLGFQIRDIRYVHQDDIDTIPVGAPIDLKDQPKLAES
jgi:hypothetical protein